ncbi:MAG: hypothetical protein SFY56_03240 [Bacteroidota bacterium]|nr:hypothetical protein [Bacteroidota bacterium]
MKKIYLSLIVFLSLLISFCSNEHPKNVSSEKKEKKVAYILAPDSIYSSHAITQALEKANAQQKTESRKQFMTGLDLLVNKNKAEASIEYFKESIFYYPDEKNYQHLFQAYLKTNKYDLAELVNNAMYDRIEYSESMFNSALLVAAKKDTSNCIATLNEAVMMGFVFKDRITQEPLFDFIRDNQSYQSLILSTFGNDEKLSRILFKSFVKSFPDLSLPYEMPVDSAKSFSFDHYVNYNYATFIPGMEDGRFSREVSKEYMAIGKFKTDYGVAFVYKVYEMMADTLNPVETNIVVYDTLGKQISTQEIGCFCSPLQSKGFVINKDFSIDIKQYKTNWETNPLDKGYAGNKITGIEEERSYKLVIKKDNSVEEIEEKQEVAKAN